MFSRQKQPKLKFLKEFFALLMLFQFSVASDLNADGFFVLYQSSALQSQNYIKYIQATSPIQCGLVCLDTEFCLSFNLAKEMDGEGLYECELLSVGMATHSLTHDSSFQHYEFVMMVSSKIVIHFSSPSQSR